MPRKVLCSMVGLKGMPTSCVVWVSTVEAPKGSLIIVMSAVSRACEASGEFTIGCFPKLRNGILSQVVDPIVSLSSSALCCPMLRDPNVGKCTEGRAVAVIVVGMLAGDLREINPLPFSGTLSDVALASSS